MTNNQRIFRIGLLAAIVGGGYWMGGWVGAVSMWVLFIFGYWIFCLANDIVKGLKRMAEPKIQIDNRTLNMNVETGRAIKGTSTPVYHRDPTRPDRELTKP